MSERIGKDHPTVAKIGFKSNFPNKANRRAAFNFFVFPKLIIYGE